MFGTARVRPVLRHEQALACELVGRRPVLFVGVAAPVAARPDASKGDCLLGECSNPVALRRGLSALLERCWQHPASLLLYDVSVQHFETEVGTLGTGSARQMGRNLKPRVPEV